MSVVRSLLIKAGLLTVLVTATAAIPCAANPPSIGAIFLYRANAHIMENCAGPTEYLRTLGIVGLGMHRVYGHRYLGATTNGYFRTYKSEGWSATRAVKELWCYRGDFDYEYFAANTFHRYSYVYWWCAGGGCFPLGHQNMAWIRGI